MAPPAQQAALEHADGPALLSSCEDLVRRALAAGADQAEVFRTHGSHVDVDIEEGRVAFAGAGTRQGGAIRVVADGRLGFAYFVDNPDKAIQHALLAAKLAPRKDFQLPAGAPVAPLSPWDNRVANLSAQDALDLAGGLLAGATAACPDVQVTGGGVSFSRGVEAIASSEGVAAHDRGTECSAGASLVLGGGDSDAVSAWHGDTAVDLLNGDDIGRIAGNKTASLANPTPVTPGAMDIVFTPEAASELILGGITRFVDGDDALRGKSVWTDAIGTAVAPAGLSITDDPTLPGGLGSVAFDGDGLATHPTPIIANGRLETFLFDAFDAHLHGRTSTGSGVRGSFQSRPGTGTHQVIVAHDDAVARDALLGEIQNGLLIDSVLGAHTANPTTGDFSVNSPNNWIIRDGELTGAGGEVAIAGNIPDMLRGLAGASTQVRRFSGAILGDLWFPDVRVSV